MSDASAPLSPCPVCAGACATPLNITREGSRLHRCPSCRAVHWAERYDAESAYASYRDYYVGRSPELSPVTESRYHAILDLLQRRVRRGRLLEVGCGMGRFLAIAEARGWEPVGLEASASAREHIERLRAREGLRFPVYEGDVLRTEFPEGSFQAVVLIEVLEHLVDPIACLKQFHGWLAPGGALYLTTPNFDSLSRLALGGRWRAIGKEHVCLFTPRTLGTALLASGFRPSSVTTKNIDIPEIIAKWRAAASGVRPRTESATESFRRVVEGSVTLRVLKSLVNRVLGLFQLGESLEVIAVRHEPPGGRAVR